MIEDTDEQLEEEICRVRSGRWEDQRSFCPYEAEVPYLPSVTVFISVEALQTL